eukprot:CAMPEP_0206454658 /NCGR_PEP_ID=MMETSP0324_2-20121206/21268_1 /ASSEMBLY_ACC=CAM_ASM_000836 /TAXON_ID=2866 /ORGANISM="Crypthecodinium cohnii, Strain Seligo" /LENGTH=234 /DNA_ID=CAMNT_0053925173 /DNA_START=49 /DNA_END=751 /DNA_ORIENTATION=-
MQRGGQQQQPQMANEGTFRSMALPMAQELVSDLDREHQKEIDYLYQEQLACRTELQRVVELMQKEVVPREKMMHEIIEGMTHSIEEATSHMHGMMAEYIANHKEKTAGSFLNRESLLNPMQEMEAELNRISALLAHGPIAPEIQGWQPGGPQGNSGKPLPQKPPSSSTEGSPRNLAPAQVRPGAIEDLAEPVQQGPTQGPGKVVAAASGEATATSSECRPILATVSEDQGTHLR